MLVNSGPLSSSEWFCCEAVTSCVAPKIAQHAEIAFVCDIHKALQKVDASVPVYRNSKSLM
jgi:hypothetical protein